MTTLEIIRQEAKILKYTDNVEHLRRLAKILSRERVVQRLTDVMFPLSVYRCITKHFQYVAAFKDGYGLPVYAGDIPDFAIDRIEAAWDLSVFQCLTIHSNVPMPISFQKVDPVVIGWLRGFHGHWASLDDSAEGRIVAMWDMDKELTVPEEGKDEKFAQDRTAFRQSTSGGKRPDNRTETR